jgi:hypothetical protein
VSYAAISLYVASQRVCIFRYRLSPEIFGYTLVHFVTNIQDTNVTIITKMVPSFLLHVSTIIFAYFLI